MRMHTVIVELTEVQDTIRTIVGLDEYISTECRFFGPLANQHAQLTQMILLLCPEGPHITHLDIHRIEMLTLEEITSGVVVSSGVGYKVKEILRQWKIWQDRRRLSIPELKFARIKSIENLIKI